MNDQFSICVPQSHLRLVLGEREPSAGPDTTPSGLATDSPSEMTAPWSRLRTEGAAAHGASRSPNTSPTEADLADMEYLAGKVLVGGHRALNELAQALEARDAEWAAACCRRLSSVGELARMRGGNLERRHTG